MAAAGAGLAVSGIPVPSHRACPRPQLAALLHLPMGCCRAPPRVRSMMPPMHSTMPLAQSQAPPTKAVKTITSWFG